MSDRYWELRQHELTRRNFLLAIEPHQKLKVRLLRCCLHKTIVYPNENVTIIEYPPDVIAQWQYIDGIINEIAKQHNVEWFPCLT